MAEKTYKLTITYNEDEDSVIDFTEEILEDNRYFSVGNLDLTDYWDEDTKIRLRNRMYDLGES